MWLTYAILASIFWGLSYVIAGKVFEYKISPISFLGIELTFVSTFLLVFNDQLEKDLKLILTDKRLFWLMVFGCATALLGNLMIVWSIKSKNPTLAGLVEISYPVFIILFSYLLFGENNMSWSVFVGGILIFIGIFIISYFN